MDAKRLVVGVLVLIILFAGTISGIILYYNQLLVSQNSKVTFLNAEITSQSVEISNLTRQVASLSAQDANLTANLGVKEITNSSVGPLEYLEFNTLFIKGTVANTGNIAAFKAGLKVVAYSANGTVEINMTVPLVHGSNLYDTDSYYGDVIDFGTDNATQSIAAYTDTGNQNSNSLQLGVLGGNQTAPININIFHEGLVTKWTVTPVWTDPN
jgi:hypothetical protein